MTQPIGPATRSEGLRRLADFLPRAGAEYADQRNYDFGPDQRSNVSMLSPFIRYRLITEQEVAAQVLGEHGREAAEKFIEEVCWRTYWKGWLELRPAVWDDYCAELEDWLGRLRFDPELRRRVNEASKGQTGIDCFDHWARELVQTGYLHNHARMWFASIWTFTLELPWALGADFFFRHLLDGDPASNTLSWRWVAGLHTPGKTYLARDDNIERFTAGRFRSVTGLAGHAAELDAPAPPPPAPLPSAQYYDHREPTALLLTEDDLSATDLADAPVTAIGGFVHPAGRSALPVGKHARTFAVDALEDALRRAGGSLGVSTHVFQEPPSVAELIDWAEANGCRQILLPYTPVGPTRGLVKSFEVGLAASPLRFATLRRTWDSRLWPLATGGFFKFKQKVMPLLEQLAGIPGTP